MTARLPLTALCALAALTWAAPADGRWRAGGAGSGIGIVALMPAGATPAAAVSAQSVTVTWTQSTFLGTRLGSFTGGGYLIKRYAQGSSTGVTPGAGCNSVVAGTTATLQCVEGAVPYGTWQYTVSPVLNTFTGAESANSANATVTTSAPSLSSVTAQNPTAGQTTGSIQIAWAATTGATGYNLYRRTSAGSYNFASPLNGSTPIATTTYADPGSGLSAATTYDYVVRALAGSPAVESASSNEAGAATISRPASPSGAVTAVAASGGQINVSWTAVSGVAGYNVYRRTAAGSYNFGSPLNGASAFAGTTYHDAATTDGTSYFYTVRSVILGAGSAQVESANSSESGQATADATPPLAPSAVTVGSGGNVQVSAICSVAAGTRFINNAGKASVSVTATISTPETGESVLFSATTPGSTPVTKTVAAGSTSVATTLDMSTLLDGTVTLSAQTEDLAGNVSATHAPANVIVKDIVAGALSNVTYTNVALFADQLNGTSECGATITATETAGPHPGNVYPTTPTQPLSGTTFSG